MVYFQAHFDIRRGVDGVGSLDGPGVLVFDFANVACDFTSHLEHVGSRCCLSGLLKAFSGLRVPNLQTNIDQTSNSVPPIIPIESIPTRQFVCPRHIRRLIYEAALCDCPVLRNKIYR